ncbi:hypothetical protein FH608_023245 [Nonomuraea phyllanthi]|uniref:Uncharacterized protein n=1 Tax=Nonomuraea phyllanthi TaxID=2219224 RepID=A0A5C4WCH6_9ACTN|nr:hypothetical protein [Nonomuraea phyllanthi]KAB8193213.1 hypothetical protein FH608_023245 [Nonomuraea phyllanthi]QFY10927.1 hypothetical protein GBF35_33815 [Nonomuraea phyllanthi]
MSRRSRRRRALPSGALAWPPGYGPGEPHWPGEGELPPDDPPGTGEGGVREPRRPKPAPPSLSAEALPPEPPVHVRNRLEPPPGEVTELLATRGGA